jgi:uncharacterized protein (DUF433 family)
MSKEIIPSNLLTRTPQGTWRITDTRVSLDSVVAAFWAGSTPEEICQDFPSLSLVQVYSTIAYYLSHQEQLDHCKNKLLSSYASSWKRAIAMS